MPSDINPGEISPMGKEKGSNTYGVTNKIALGRLGMRLLRSREDRAKGTPEPYNDDDSSSYFHNVAELDTHRSQLRMTEAANAANIRDMELSRSAGHLSNRISAARTASVIRNDEGQRVGEIGVDDKALGIKTGGYRLPDRLSRDLGNDNGSQQTPVEELFSPKPSRTQHFAEGTRTVVPTAFDMRGASVQTNPDTNKNEPIPGRQEMADSNKELKAKKPDIDARNAEAAEASHKARTGKEMPEGSMQPQKPLMVPTAQSNEYDAKRQAGKPGFDRTAADEASKY